MSEGTLGSDLIKILNMLNYMFATKQSSSSSQASP